MIIGIVLTTVNNVCVLITLDFLLFDQAFFYSLTFLSQSHHLILVTAQSQSLIEAIAYLTLQLSFRPLLLEALYLIERTSVWIFHSHQNQIMTPRKLKHLIIIIF